MKKFLISIITSEKTWSNFSKFGFDEQIKKLRDKFDFAVVLNGHHYDAIDFYRQFKPEYFFLRPNLGFDTAAIAYFIDLVPEYDRYLIMHDDHWFGDDNWFDRINNLKDEQNDVDIWGNILMQGPMANFKKYCHDVNLSELADNDKVDFLHGMSGLFNLQAISKLKNFKIPYIMSTEKEVAFLGERLFSNIIAHLGLKMAQFPEGIFNFFLHGEDNYKNHLFSTANVAFLKKDFQLAKEYYYKYYEHCEGINFFDNMPELFNNLACTHYELKEIEEAKVIWKNLLAKIPDFPVPAGVRELVNN
ncbi:MAG: hypothetical protein PVH88_25070 [Ignavibacteria bacterium]|jgi:hypothetical protein